MTADPERWLSGAQTPLAAHERDALRALSLRGPDRGARARIWERIEQASLHATSNARPEPPPRAGSWWRWLAGGSLALLLVTSALVRFAPARSALPSVDERTLTVPAPPSEPLADTAAVPAVASAVSAPQADAPGVARAPVTRVERVVQPRDPIAELALLTPARQLLAVDPARALALADEHARRFARGAFSEERSFLRIAALVRLGEHSAAQREARLFRRAYPGSTYRERVEQLLPAAH